MPEKKTLVTGLAAGILMGWTCVSAAASHPGTPISIQGLHHGRVRFERGSQKLVLSLGRDISGCKSRLYDPMTKEESDAGVSWEVVDETVKASDTYVLLLASASPNCNVEGRCGAGGPDSTLLWLKLTKGLKLAGKKAVVFEQCTTNRQARLPATDSKVEAPDEPAEIKAKDLPWNGDVLQIEYEEGAVEPVVVRRLVYDRRNPEAGLKVIDGTGSMEN
jgi:hypothetical protein